MPRQDGVNLTDVRESNASYTRKRALCFCISNPQGDLTDCLFVCTAGASECTACDGGRYSTTIGAASTDTCLECVAGKYSTAGVFSFNKLAAADFRMGRLCVRKSSREAAHAKVLA